MPLLTLRKTPSHADFEREAMPHLDALHAAALRMTRDQREAEDLVQESLLRAYRFFDKFEPGTNCKAWLFRILTNQFCSRYRERERERDVLDEAESSTANLEQFVSGAGADEIEDRVLSNLVSGEVEEALASLPSDFRVAVILADLEDFSYKEIAEIMDCPAGTVMSRLHRGRRMLQEKLFDYAREHGIVKGERSGSGADVAPPIDLESYRRQRRGEGGR